jgi:hypothetical protein
MAESLLGGLLGGQAGDARHRTCGCAGKRRGVCFRRRCEACWQRSRSGSQDPGVPERPSAAPRHSDLAGADAKLRAAQERGPGWADPLKAWGDVLAREGRTQQGLEKYDQALKLAPSGRS